MPEGDTLRLTAARLAPVMVGQTLRSIRPVAFRRLENHVVTSVAAYGKHLFMEFDSGLALHSHLRMRGAWRILRADREQAISTHDSTAVLCFDQHIILARAVPVLEIVKGRVRVQHLGPDILSKPPDEATIFERAQHSEMETVGELLLDQTVAAGIGNIWRCEALWNLGVNPWTPWRSLGPSRLTELYTEAFRLMSRSVEGRRRHHVHGRGGLPCARCGSRIQVRTQGRLARFTYWCPVCQPQRGGTDPA
jgi:endonuclease-8